MDKKQLKIPTYFLVIIFALILCIIFVFVVQIPFSQKLDTYNRDHESVTAQISKYNDYCELLFAVHNKNIEFELANPEIKEKPTKKRTKKVKIENKYIREETSDLFDGHTTYIYSNFKTGDVIYSDNPNLLEELNKPKEKKKKTKVVQGSFTFNFNKNK